MINPFDSLSVSELGPDEFEKFVTSLLHASSHGPADLEVLHREKLRGADGTYEIDVTVRFRLLGADFLVLVECKHHRRPVERDDVQVLKSRLDSLGAQKGMLFSSSGFQSGAIEFAAAHGIALVRVADGSTRFETRSLYPPARQIVDDRGPIGWMIKKDGDSVGVSVVDIDVVTYLDAFLAE